MRGSLSVRQRRGEEDKGDEGNVGEGRSVAEAEDGSLDFVGNEEERKRGYDGHVEKRLRGTVVIWDQLRKEGRR